MSNQNQSSNANDNTGSVKTDPTRTTGAPRTDQQAQEMPRQDKSAKQQGGSDRKSGQQSQGGSRADDDGMKQAGSAHVANSPSDAGQKTGATK
jgi:hypothetical protein